MSLPAIGFRPAIAPRFGMVYEVDYQNLPPNLPEEVTEDLGTHAGLQIYNQMPFWARFATLWNNRMAQVDFPRLQLDPIAMPLHCEDPDGGQRHFLLMGKHIRAFAEFLTGRMQGVDTEGLSENQVVSQWIYANPPQQSLNAYLAHELTPQGLRPTVVLTTPPILPKSAHAAWQNDW